MSARVRILILTLIVVAAFNVHAAPKQPQSDAVSRWKVLEASSIGPAAVEWNADGRGRAVFGRFGRLDAISFLDSNRELFGIDRVENLVASRNVSSPVGSHVAFRQVYRGVDVYGGEAFVQFDTAGDLIAAGNNFVRGIDLASVSPRIDMADAIDAVAARLPVLSGMRRQSLGDVSARLVIYRFEGRDHLAWEIVAAANGRTWQIFEDAHNGSVLGEPRDMNRYVNGTGQVFRVNAVVATRNNTLTDQDDAASAVPASAYMRVVLQGLFGNGKLEGEFASSDRSKKQVSSPANAFIFERDSDGFSETMAYYYIDYAERYIQSLGFTNVNNRSQVFSINRFKPDNSFYSEKTKEITLGIGGVDDAEDAEVILHEYGHSIQDDQKPGFGTTLESGSIGEGFGDYWGATVGAQLSGGFQDLCLAEWDAVSYSTDNPPCLRRLDSPKHYPENVRNEVHADGEMWSAAMWQIRTAIGAAKADKLVLQSHFLMTVDTSFNQASNAVVTAAINLGFRQNEINSIRTILRNRGFTVTM